MYCRTVRSLKTTLGECPLQYVSIKARLEPALNSFLYGIERRLGSVGLRGNIKCRTNGNPISPILMDYNVELNVEGNLVSHTGSLRSVTRKISE